MTRVSNNDESLEKYLYYSKGQGRRWNIIEFVRRSWIAKWAPNTCKYHWFCFQRWRRINCHKLCIVIKKTIYYTIIHCFCGIDHCWIHYRHKVEKIALTLKWAVLSCTTDNWVHRCHSSSWHIFIFLVWYARPSINI